MCREYTFYPAPTPLPPPRKIHQVSPSNMGGERDNNTARLHSLMADEQENQIKQISKIKFKKSQIKRYYSYSAKKMRNSSLIQKHSTKQKKNKIK